MSKFNYFNNILVDGYNFPSSAQADFNFISAGIALLNRSNYVIEYSFNGIDLHGDLRPTEASRGLIFDNRNESKMWFRAADGYGTVRIEAWSWS